MFQKRYRFVLLSALILLIAALALPSRVYAGGWVVITLDELPTQIVAGQPYRLGLMARQHGQTPWKAPELRVEAKQSETGQTVSFIARPDQQPGHYTVELLFPQPGRWEWGVQSGLFPTIQPMPALEVTGVAAAPATQSMFNGSTGLLAAVALLSLIIGVGLIVRYRRQKLPLVAGGGLLVLSGLLVFVFFSSANARAGRIQPSSTGKLDRDTGQQLFLAKGCVVCHVNTRVMKDAESYSVSVGPNLSAYHNDPAYLRQFLANPKGLGGPGTTFPMPNLGLSTAEIDALVNFINDSPPR